MGRGKVVLEKIENKINRQVTFTKRRNGLFKKAQELSVLCDAQVAVIVSSGHGKLFDYASTDDMNEILQRYHQVCYSSSQDSGVESESQSLYQEVSRLKARYESLQRSQKHYLGEDIGNLRLKELQNLENQLDKSLSRARQRKTQMMLDQLEALRRKENDLGQINERLKSELEQVQIQGPGERGNVTGQPNNMSNKTGLPPNFANQVDSQQPPTFLL